MTEPVQLIPIVLVDDDPSVIKSAVRSLERKYPDREIYTFLSIDVALSTLETIKIPFVLILDHNFPDKDEQGHEMAGALLATQLRSTHPWGMVLPICYYSGKFNEEEWTKLKEREGLYSPSIYRDKNDDVSVQNIVEELDQQFARVRQNFLRQAEELSIMQGYDFDNDESDED